MRYVARRASDRAFVVWGRTMIYNERDADPDSPCNRCGAPTTSYDWWDDPPEDGGAFLDVVRECTRCDWSTY